MWSHLNLIYELIIILYAVCLLGYFIDFLENNRKANRIAFWLLSIVWVLQTTYFIINFLHVDRLAIVSPFEGLYMVAWIIVSLSLLINWFSRIDFFVFFANVIGFIIMAIHLFTPRNDLPPLITMSLSSELLLFHIAMVVLAYGAFTLSFVFSFMYFIQYEMLKSKRWVQRFGRFGNLEQLEKMSFFFAMFGVPLFLLSIILGLIWGKIAIDPFNYFDAKVIASFVVLICYSYYLYMKVVKDQRGINLSLMNNFSYLLLLVNIFYASSLSNFHWWYG